MVSTRRLISKSSNHFTNSSVTLPKAPITIGINVTFMFLRGFFVNSLARSKYIFFFSSSFNISMWSTGTAKSAILQVLHFLLIITRSVHLAEIRWSVCISKSLRFFASHSPGRILVSVFHTNVSRWFFTGVLVIANVLKFPRLSSVFWPISTML